MNTDTQKQYGGDASSSDELCTLRFDELRSTNVTRCDKVFHPLSDWSPCDWATAMAGECGDACNNVKKLRRLDGADAPHNTPERRQHLQNEIGKELADLVIYADLLAARLGIDLGKSVVQKFNEVSDRRECDVKLKLRTESNQPISSPGTGSASAFKNPHIVVGEPRRCICGMYNGEPIGCKDVLASLNELVRQANIRGSGVSLYSHDILRIESVIKPLVQDCL